MKNFNKVINQDLIELDLQGKNKDAVVEELTDLLVKQNRLHSRVEYVANVYEREKSLTTYCGSEVAIPHAISSAVKTTSICFGRSKGLHWDNKDELVRFVFMFAIPEGNHDKEHVAIMSAIARCCLDPETREMWLKATTKEQILESIWNSVQKS